MRCVIKLNLEYMFWEECKNKLCSQFGSHISDSVQDFLLIWLIFLKERIVCSIFLGIKPIYQICNFLLIPVESVIFFLLMLTNFIYFDVAVLDRSHMPIKSWFKWTFGFTKVHCLTISTVNFINNADFLFSSNTTFRFTKQFVQCVFYVKWRCDLVRFEYMR